MTLAARGRGDEALEWEANGMDAYEDVSLDALVGAQRSDSCSRSRRERA